jgi:transcriptional regulator with XRE-family HTH domain
MSEFRFLMTQQEIAEKAGISQQMVSYIINGDRIPSIEVAVKLEKATGFPRESWLFPERHYNAYIPLLDGEDPGWEVCKYRIAMVNHVTDLMLEDFSKHRDFRRMLEISSSFQGFDNREIVSTFRIVTRRGLELLASTLESLASTPFKINHGDEFRWLYERAVAGLSVHVPYYPVPPYVLEGAEHEFAIALEYGIRCFMAVSSGRLWLSEWSMGRRMVWSPEVIDRLAWFIHEVDKLYQPHQG